MINQILNIHPFIITIVGLLLIYFIMSLFKERILNPDALEESRSKIKSIAKERTETAYQKMGVLDAPKVAHGKEIKVSADWAMVPDLCATIKGTKASTYVDKYGRRAKQSSVIKFEEKIVPKFFKVESGIEVRFHPDSSYGKLKEPNYKRFILNQLYQQGLIDSLSWFFSETDVPCHFIIQKGKTRPIFQGGIQANYDKWMDLLLNIKNKKHALLAGISDNPRDEFENAITADDGVSLKIEMASAPHALFAGATRTGKTKSALSFVYSILKAYPDTRILCYDGKNQTDLDGINEAFGIFNKVAHDRSDIGQPNIELDNLIFYLKNECVRRQGLYRDLASSLLKSGKNIKISTIVEYNEFCEEQGFPRIGRYILLCDEFQSAIQGWAKGGGYEKLTKSGSENSAKALARVIAQAASLGIHVIVMTQTLRQDNLPKLFQANFTLRFIHALPAGELGIVNVGEEATQLEKGQFILIANGVHTKTKDNPICRLPYVGDVPQYELNENEPIERMEYDYDLLMSLSEIDSNTILGAFKSILFKKESIECGEPKTKGNYFNNLEFVFNDQKWRAIAIDIKQLNDEALSEIYRLFSETGERLLFLLVGEGELKSKIQSSIREADKVIGQTAWYRILEATLEGCEDNLFTDKLLNEIRPKTEEERKLALSKNSDEFYNSSDWSGVRFEFQVLTKGHEKCSLCPEKDLRKLQVDHIVPRSKAPWLALKLSNLQWLCAKCNRLKSNKYNEDWRPEEVKEIILKHEASLGSQSSSEVRKTAKEKEQEEKQVIKDIIRDNMELSTRALEKILTERGLKRSIATISEYKKQIMGKQDA